MTLPSWLSIGLALGAATAGGAVVVVVLTTSGPFANSQDEPAPPSAAAEKTVTATHPSPTPTVDHQPGELAPDQPFDPAKLPPVDTSGWVAYEGPLGELRLRVPPGWIVRTKEATDYKGEIVVGDAAKVLRSLPVREEVAAPGDVWGDLATGPEPHPYRTTEAIFYQVTVPAIVSGKPVEVFAIQFTGGFGLQPGVGLLTLYVSFEGASGRYLNGGIHVALPADWATIATAQAILTEVIWR
jgi:hypothetical protein